VLRLTPHHCLPVVRDWTLHILYNPTGRSAFECVCLCVHRRVIIWSSLLIHSHQTLLLWPRFSFSFLRMQGGRVKRSQNLLGSTWPLLFYALKGVQGFCNTSKYILYHRQSCLFLSMSLWLSPSQLTRGEGAASGSLPRSLPSCSDANVESGEISFEMKRMGGWRGVEERISVTQIVIACVRCLPSTPLRYVQYHWHHFHDLLLGVGVFVDVCIHSIVMRTSDGKRDTRLFLPIHHFSRLPSFGACFLIYHIVPMTTRPPITGRWPFYRHRAEWTSCSA